MKWQEWLRFKILISFPTATLDEKAETVTMPMFDVFRLLDRLDYLENPPAYDLETGKMAQREEPPRFITNYREGSWIDWGPPTY